MLPFWARVDLGAIAMKRYSTFPKALASLELQLIYGDRDKTINHITSKCSKLAQKKYKTRDDWVEKVIHWELCKRLKFDPNTKWYLHKPESVLENVMLKIPRDFKVQTDCLILVRRPDLDEKKKSLSSSGFCCSSGLQRENERKQKDKQILGSCLSAEKAVKHESNSNTIVGALGTITVSWKREWLELKSEEESRPNRLEHCWICLT